MAKTVQTLSPEFIEEAAWAIEQVKRILRGNLQDTDRGLQRAHDGVVVKIPTGGIPARYNETLYGEYCDLYRILDSDPDDDVISLEAILDGNDAPVQTKVFNFTESAAEAGTYQVSELFRSGHRYVNLGPQLTGGCLQQDHPGRGTPFHITLGEWQSDDYSWDYTGETVYAVDWRYGVPYPDAGATGLFTPRGSDDYVTIWEVVALDCSSPGECGD